MKKLFITVAAIGMSTAAFAQAPIFSEADTDMSGGVTITEAQALWPEMTQEEFDAADTNADGQLDQAEFDTYVATLPAM